MTKFTIAPEGFQATSGAYSLHTAVQRILALLYPLPKPARPKKKGEMQRDRRNAEIRQRYADGERAILLAEEYGMTLQALYKMLRQAEMQV